MVLLPGAASSPPPPQPAYECSTSTIRSPARALRCLPRRVRYSTRPGADGSHAGAGRCFGRRRGPLCHCACWRCVRVRPRKATSPTSYDGRRRATWRPPNSPRPWTPTPFGAKEEKDDDEEEEAKEHQAGLPRSSTLRHGLRRHVPRAATTRVTLLLRCSWNMKPALKTRISRWHDRLSHCLSARV